MLFTLLFSFFRAAVLAQEEANGARVESELEKLRTQNEEIRKRLDTLELDNEEARHSFGLLSRFVEVSGYADAEFYLTDKDGESSRFRVRHLSLFFIKDIQKDWKLFSEIEYEDAPLIESAHTTDDSRERPGQALRRADVHRVPSDSRVGRPLRQVPDALRHMEHIPLPAVCADPGEAAHGEEDIPSGL